MYFNVVVTGVLFSLSLEVKRINHGKAAPTDQFRAKKCQKHRLGTRYYHSPRPNLRNFQKEAIPALLVEIPFVIE